MAPLSRPPAIAWPELRSKLRREWRAGEHVTIIGPTGSGKTHIALALLDLCPYTLVIAAKRRDPLLDELRDRFVTQDLSEIVYTPDDRPLPQYRHVIFWPRFPEKLTAEQRMARQAVLIRRALDYADRTGHWAVLIDELNYLHESLRLERSVSHAYFQGRSQGLSIIGCAQRPARVPLFALSQASYLFLFQTADKRDVERLREISSGFPKELIEGAVRQLDAPGHEVLFVDTKRRELAVTVAPPRS